MIDNSIYTLGKFPKVYYDLLWEAPHILIAGSTGSGKSVCLHGLIYTSFYMDSELILIDLKRVELIEFKQCAICYADTIQEAEKALDMALNIIEYRFQDMQKRRIKTYGGKPLYICIDECADLFLNSKQAKKQVIRICQIARAANVHVIACTQCMLAKLLDTQLLVNFDFRIGLRTATKNHSRLIIGVDGCETLPFPKSAGYAEMLLYQPSGITKYYMPMIPNETMQEAITIRTLPQYRKRKSIFQRIKEMLL